MAAAASRPKRLSTLPGCIPISLEVAEGGGVSGRMRHHRLAQNGVGVSGEIRAGIYELTYQKGS